MAFETLDKFIIFPQPISGCESFFFSDCGGSHGHHNTKCEVIRSGHRSFTDGRHGASTDWSVHCTNA